MQSCLFINKIKVFFFLWTIKNQTIRNNLFASSLWFDGSSYKLKMQLWARLWWLLLSFAGDSDHHFYFLILTFTRRECISLHAADHFDTAELISLAHPFKKAQRHWSVTARICPQPRAIMMKAKCALGLLSSGVLCCSCDLGRHTGPLQSPQRTGGALAFLCKCLPWWQ